jgi:hypothetical protein
MNQAQLFELAKRAGGQDWGIFRDFMPEIERLAKFVSEAERERAAMICHQYSNWSDNPAEAIAEAILKGE